MEQMPEDELARQRTDLVESERERANDAALQLLPEEGGRIATREERLGTLIISSLLAALGLFWMAASQQIPSRSNLGLLTPAFVPFWAGVIMATIAAILFLRWWRMPSKPSNPDGGDRIVELRGLWRVAGTVAVLVAYLFLLTRVHYVISTFFVVAAGLMMAGEPLKPRLIAVAVVASAIFYAIFLAWLSVPLPGSRYG